MKGVCVEQRHKNEQSGQGSKEIGAMMAKRDDDYWDKPANGASQWSQPMEPANGASQWINACTRVHVYREKLVQ